MTHALDVLTQQSKKKLDVQTYIRWDAMRHVILTYQLHVVLVLVPIAIKKKKKNHLSKKL